MVSYCFHVIPCIRPTRSLGSVGCASSALASAPVCHQLCIVSVLFGESKSKEELVKAGMEREFVGRLPVRVALQALSDEDLFQVLTLLGQVFYPLQLMCLL